MKKNYFLLLFLTLSAPVFAQQNHEFGFVAKVGTYALPYQKKENTSNVAGDWNTFQQRPGDTYTFGLWYAHRLSDYVRISGELLYRRASIVSEEGHFSEYYDNGILQHYEYRQNQKITENNLSLPVKLYVSFQKNGNTTLALGAGLSRVFSGNILGTTSFKYSQNPSSSYSFPLQNFGWEQFELEKTLTAGLFHRLDAKTSIGFEYTFEQSSSRQYAGYLPSLALVDCMCYGYYTIPIRNMNSFSVSLKHNILGEKAKR